LGDVVSGETSFRYALVNMDRGPVAATFVDEVLSGIRKEGLIQVRTADSLKEGRRQARDGDVSATFVIPEGFSEEVQAGKPSELIVIGNADDQTAVSVAWAIAESFAAEIQSTGVAVGTVSFLETAGPSDPARGAELARRAQAISPPVSVADRSASRRALDTRTFFAAGMAVFFLFFTVQFGVTGILNERTDGTLFRLLAAPVPRIEILVGKLVTSFALGVASTSVLAVATTLLLGASWGNPAGLALLIVFGVLAATGVAALVTTFARTADQAGNYTAIIAVILGALGGSFFPTEQGGPVLSALSRLTPHAWFLRGLSDMQADATAIAVLPSVVALALFAAATGTIAALRMRRLVRP
jgi:ABC-2 type transport system permease protein